MRVRLETQLALFQLWFRFRENHPTPSHGQIETSLSLLLLSCRLAPPAFQEPCTSQSGKPGGCPTLPCLFIEGAPENPSAICPFFLLQLCSHEPDLHPLWRTHDAPTRMLGNRFQVILLGLNVCCDGSLFRSSFCGPESHHTLYIPLAECLMQCDVHLCSKWGYG